MELCRTSPVSLPTVAVRLAKRPYTHSQKGNTLSATASKKLTGCVPYAMLLSEVSKLTGDTKSPSPIKGLTQKWDYDLKVLAALRK